MVGVSSVLTSLSASCSVNGPKTRIGHFRPAARSSAPSSTVYTPSQDAPAARAAFATGTAPCPYALAFTTTMTSLGFASRHSARTLASSRSSSTIALVWRTTPLTAVTVGETELDVRGLVGTGFLGEQKSNDVGMTDQPGEPISVDHEEWIGITIDHEGSGVVHVHIGRYANEMLFH